MNPNYQEMKWPDDYWPDSAPPTPTAWDQSVAAHRRDNDKMKSWFAPTRSVCANPARENRHQIYIRSVLLVADHAAYHLGRSCLRDGCWESDLTVGLQKQDPLYAARESIFGPGRALFFDPAKINFFHIHPRTVHQRIRRVQHDRGPGLESCGDLSLVLIALAERTVCRRT